jgi:Raf kinase inhibitor-like YbhB/YbcL family protein
MAEFTLTSPTVKPNATLPLEHVLDGPGYHGRNTSPALVWSGEPPGTRSFAITVFDPDAPTGSGWWHWQVWNIPASVHALPAGAGEPSGKKLPPGALQGRNDYAVPGFGGAAPPPGPPHRYLFTVHALRVEKLDATTDHSAAAVSFMINAARLGSTGITALFGC